VIGETDNNLVEEIDKKLEELQKELFRRLIEKVTVYDDKLTIEFKSGLEVDV
jgi:site-specific DNA recombinase